MEKQLVGVIGGEQKGAGHEERHGGAGGGGEMWMRDDGAARSDGGAMSDGVDDSEVHGENFTVVDAVAATEAAARGSSVRQASRIAVDRAAEGTVCYVKELTVMAEVVEGDRVVYFYQ